MAITGDNPKGVNLVDHGQIAGEPESDKLLVTENGVRMRRRMTVTQSSDGVTSAASPFSTALTASFSFALLDKRDGVVKIDGKPVIAPAYEVSFTTEALGRLGTAQAVRDALNDAQGRAALQAEIAFTGAALAADVLAF